jgi:hypothetical protein
VSEGWDGGDMGDWQALGLTTVTLQPDGGNPEGYLEVVGDPWAGILTEAPAWGGDWGRGGIHEILVHYRLLSSVDGVYVPYVRIRRDASSNGWEYYGAELLPDDGRWHRFAVPVDAGWSDAEAEAAGWALMPGGTEWTFAETATSVDYVLVEARATTLAEAVGIDNVELTCWLFADDFESGDTGAWIAVE